MKKKAGVYSLLWVVILIFSLESKAQKEVVEKKSGSVKNIVLVHGAFVDGSGWEPVYRLLKKRGFRVSVVQQPLSSFEADVAAVNRVIRMQDGPCLLVGHSYGGAIITVAGNAPEVVGLVYIAAHMPDEGESEADNGKRYPSAYSSLVKGKDSLDFIMPEKFHMDFAADLSVERASFAAHSQMPIADAAFHKVIHNPAWKVKPSWYMVAKKDRIINPELERLYAKRAKSVTVEAEGASHSVYESQPQKVASLIQQAADSF